ncbi:MAG: hypothetical protein ACLFPH_05115 [Bacteroidales bacterium]
MKKITIIILSIMLFVHVQAQDQKNTIPVFRVNFINPGIEYESPVLNQSTIVFNGGIGYGESYPNTTLYASGWLYLIVPFTDIQFRNYYNLDKRLAKGKNIRNNSGNFWGIRMLTRFKELDGNFTRTSGIDFAINPMWGLQRSYGNINLLFDIGIAYYFDDVGNDGVAPTLEFGIGYNFKKKE